jgi:hypothetical protein
MKEIYILPTGQVLDNAINIEMGRLDPENLCFDRLTEFSKYAFRSAAKQLAEAIILGLQVPSQFVTSHIEHACNVFACAVFLDPTLVKNPKFTMLLDVVDRLDTFGPAYPVPESVSNQVRALMGPIWKLRNEGKLYSLAANEIAELLKATAQQVADYCNGTYELMLEKESPRTFQIIDEYKTMVMVESSSFIFDLLYKKSYRIAIVYRKLSDGYKYDIAKQSEFVRFDILALIGELNKLEAGWAGTSTTGHSPRSHSQIEPKQVWDLMLNNTLL